MARKACHVILIISLLTSVYLGMAAPNWETDLTSNINAEVNRMLKNLDANLRILDTNTENLNKQVDNLNRRIENSVQQTLAQVDETFKNLSRDGQGRLITNGQVITSGGNIVINSVNGVSMIRKTESGYTLNGTPYMNITTDTNDGKYFQHNATFYNSTSDAMETICWKLKLEHAPDAQPEYFPCK
ncbi:PREDICTED: uncharacterized protein LOC105154717 [Acromyrmex echinatior]|uniref:uncharacterized protein LOC105154717 n=1 Tax=Acromyrmex echinatior TaxID=103372 RepID=UPI000580FA0C|nr:PREDICTED: uncharacterized protein LOC105154717 [Acromyrmex echinatior]